MSITPKTSPKAFSKTNGARLFVAIIALAIVTSVVTVTAYMQSGKRAANSKARTDVPSKIFVGAGDSANRPAATGTCDTGMNIDVEATGGTAQTGYASLNAAFAAINAGTHTGTINIEICASETEPAGSAVLNSSGAGSASYTSINIYPLADGLTVSGASATGRGVIELNGADNVTINGDNPNTMGTNRNLTIQNTAAATVTFTSVVRIALATSVVTSADNDTIKNLNLVGNATGRNVSGATSTTGTENSVYGVLATAGASTTSATTAPSAIAAVSTTIGSPATASNLLIDNNSVATCARGIAVQGSATTVFPGLAISNNLIGNATASAVDQVYSVGITAQGSANGVISGNTVYIESFLPSSTSAANRAIDVGGISANATFTIERNMVNRAKNNAPDFWLAHGINLGGGSNHVVRNNFVQNITVNTTSGGFYDTTFNASGIRVASGTGHKIYHNSVNLTGVIPGATNTITACLLITSTTLTGIDARNNILVNSLTGGSATSAHVAVYLPSGGTSAMNLTLNNNDYFNGAAPTATQGVGQVGITAGTGFFTQANFDPTMTTPATNFRSYTSTLSAGGANDNASKKVDPQFLSATDLHIAAASPMVDMGATVGVTNDIDGQSRVPPPDIGADEPGGVTPPANDIAAVAIVNPPTGSTRAAGTPFTVQASFTNGGTAAQTNVPVRFKITDTGNNMVVYNMTATIASINSGQTVTVTFPNATLPAGSYTTMASSELVGDQAPANDSVMGTLTVLAPLNGTVTVGTAGNYASLSNAGGVFDALNNAGATSNIVINITSDLTGETGTIALNELAGGFSVTIKPSGGARMITGSSTVGIIRLNDTDNVTIDGSLTGGTATGLGGDPSLRNLTVQNTNTAATAGGVIIIGQSTNGAQNVTIKNVNVSGQDPAQTLIGISIGSITPGASPTANNNNVRVENCSVQKAILGIFYNGVSAANPNTGAVITRNDLSATGANRLKRGGIFFFNQRGILVTENKIGGINTDESADAIGIIAGIQNVNTTATTSGGVTNALIARNLINGVVATSTIGFSAAGIAVAGDAGGGANVVVNNMISGVTAPSTSPDIVAGIFVAGVAGSSTKLYHNSISLTGDRQAVASEIGSYGVAISGSNPVVEVKDNIFYTTQTSSGGGAAAKSYALGMATTAAAATNLDANYNDYFFSGANAAGFRTASLDTSGTDIATLAAWQTATSKDANSLSVDPLYVDPTTNLHLQAGSPVINMGTPVSVTNDIDGQTRVPPPDIGADEQAGITVPRRQIADFDGENKTDASVWNPNNHNWYIRDSGTGMTRTIVDWGNGALGDIAVPGDYDGDGKIDVAVWRPSEGNWYIIRSSNNTVLLQNWGLSGDIPVPGDYDADGKADFAVMRPSEGNWYILKSSGGGTVQGWGTMGDKPVPADYDGDGKTDIAVYRPSEGNWYILSSFSNTGSVRNWGISTDVPVPADYDGDNKADLALYRNGDWFIIRSTNGLSSVKTWGTPTDIPVPGDYDGDGNADIAVWRPAEGNWYILQSSGGNTLFNLGTMGDVPAPATYHP